MATNEQITKSDMDRIARKARRMAKITDIPAITWFRYLVLKEMDRKGV
jgi:hypothetical protein